MFSQEPPASPVQGESSAGPLREEHDTAKREAVLSDMQLLEQDTAPRGSAEVETV